MSADCLTAIQRENIIEEIFDGFKYNIGLRNLRAAVPNVPDEILTEFVEEAYHELLDWSSNV
jgi:hypothetical protein